MTLDQEVWGWGVEETCFLLEKGSRHPDHVGQTDRTSPEKSEKSAPWSSALWDRKLALEELLSRQPATPSLSPSSSRSPTPPSSDGGLHASPGGVNPGDPSKVASFTQQLFDGSLKALVFPHCVPLPGPAVNPHPHPGAHAWSWL